MWNIQRAMEQYMTWHTELEKPTPHLIVAQQFSVLFDYCEVLFL